MGEEDDENKLDMESVDIATPDEDGKPSRSILRTDGMSDPNVDHQHVRLEVISEKDTVSEKGKLLNYADICLQIILCCTIIL